MRTEKGANEQPRAELKRLRQRVAELEKGEMESKRAEKELKSERDKLQALMDGLARTEIGIDIVGIDYRVVFQNQTLKQRFGDLSGQLCYEKYMGLERPCDFCPMMKAIRRNRVESIELIAADGRNYELFSAPLPNPDGTVDKAIEVVLDVTQRKRAEQALKESEERYRSLFENSIEAVFTVDIDGSFTSGNKALEELTGYAMDELIGASYKKIVAPENVDFVFKEFNKLFRTSEPIASVPYELVTKNGETRLSEGYVNVIRQGDWIVGFQGTLRDITERKRAEEALRESERNYRVLFESTVDGVIVMDETMKLLTANRAAAQIGGFDSVEELLKSDVLDFIPPEEIQRLLTIVTKDMFGNDLRQANEFRVTHEAGKEMWVSAVGTLTEYQGKPAGLVSFRDVTQARKVEQALRESEERYRNLIENALDIIFTISPDGTITSLNPAFETITGWSRSEWIGKQFVCLLHPDDLPRAMELFQDAVQAKRAGTLEARVLAGSGEYLQVEVRSTPLTKNEKIVGFWGITRDITERKKAEEAIKASLKEKEILLMEIQHRVKNNLQVISSLLRLQAGYIEDERYAAMFKESQSRVQSIALIHDKLYQSEDLARVDCGEYIKSLAGAVFRSYGSDAARIALKTEVEGIMLGANYAMPCGLIINELVSNSLKHAFPKGEKGEIRIAMRPTAENEVELVVSDNGIGVPEDLDFGNTESLGLQLVTILAEDQLGGQIELDRTGGTRFQIRFGVAE